MADKARWRAHAANALAVTALLGGLHFVSASVGMGWGWMITIALVLGAIARQVLPVDPYKVMVTTGLVILVLWKPRFAAYEIFLVVALWSLRHRSRAFFVLLILGALVGPKTLRYFSQHAPQYWDWISQTSLTHILIVSMLWWAERARDRVGDAGLPQWLTFYASPPNPLNPMNFGPGHMWQPPRTDHKAAAQTLLLIGSKGLALWLINTYLATLIIQHHGGESLFTLSWLGLWQVVAVSYVRLMLYLSGTADVAVMILRVFGWQLEHPYRWALLAWNPVELWRRWSIYNRKLLLKLIYFPLGGGHRRRYLNVMLTFLGSAWLLHSGWFGSYYWTVGFDGLRDQTVYFMLQGIAVCMCLSLWQRRGKDPGSDRALRFSGLRIASTLGTQAYSAVAHVIVLAPHVGWGERWRLMGRCLGLYWQP